MDSRELFWLMRGLRRLFLSIRALHDDAANIRGSKVGPPPIRGGGLDRSKELRGLAFGSFVGDTLLRSGAEYSDLCIGRLRGRPQQSYGLRIQHDSYSVRV